MLLDTNVISELMRPTPKSAVVAFFARIGRDKGYLATPVLAELHFGAAQLVPSRRRAELEAAIERLETEIFAGRILSFDAAAARENARIRADRKALGRPISFMDSQIAAIARVHGLTLATRNIRDFAETGIDLVDPFAL